MHTHRTSQKTKHHAGQLAIFSRQQLTVMMQEIGVAQVGEIVMIFTLKSPTALFFFWTSILYLFMAVMGLRFCARAFSSCGKWGPLFIAVRGPLTIAASLVAEHRLQTRRLSNCGSWA